MNDIFTEIVVRCGIPLVQFRLVSAVRIHGKWETHVVFNRENLLLRMEASTRHGLDISEETRALVALTEWEAEHGKTS